MPAEIPAAIAAEAALTRQNVSLSVIRQNAEADRSIANILQQSSANVPLSETRGANVNRSV